jgi:hypothetical protein
LIQLGDQIFEPAHRVQFRQNCASLIDSPRIDSRELSLLQP